MGVVPPERFLFGQTVDTDVQKAADRRTKSKNDAVQQYITDVIHRANSSLFSCPIVSHFEKDVKKYGNCVYNRAAV